ncbi:hypothetical protein QE152_g21780 [Popillia japonica]|uniref:Uncharacterized protein n=1 Tax=Popillia japonica TaxID=7064 RepID=A0AAW1KNN6_POPJA
MERNIVSFPKLLWSYARNRRTSHSIPSIITPNERTAMGGAEISKLFSDHFASIFNRYPDYGNDAVLNGVERQVSSSNLIINCSIDESIIIEKNKKLETSKGAGPDGLTSFFVRSCGEALAVAFNILFNKSISSTVPTTLENISCTHI